MGGGLTLFIDTDGHDLSPEIISIALRPDSGATSAINFYLGLTNLESEAESWMRIEADGPGIP